MIDENARVVCPMVKRQTEPISNSLARRRYENIGIPPESSLTPTVQFNRPIEIESTRGSWTGAGLSHGLAKPGGLGALVAESLAVNNKGTLGSLESRAILQRSPIQTKASVPPTPSDRS